MSISEFFRLHHPVIITNFRPFIPLSSSVFHHDQLTSRLVLIDQAFGVRSWFSAGDSVSLSCLHGRVVVEHAGDDSSAIVTSRRGCTGASRQTCMAPPGQPSSPGVENSSVSSLLAHGGTVSEDIRGSMDLIREQHDAATRVAFSPLAAWESVRNDLAVTSKPVSQRR